MTETLAEDLRRVRIAMGLTQQQVADKSGLSLTSIKSYEAGRPACPANMAILRATMLSLVPTVSRPRGISDEWEVQGELRMGDVRIVVHKAKRRSQV